MKCFGKINKSDYPYITPDEEACFHHKRDLKCDRKLEQYKRKLSGPDWYEELTERQVAAANMLFTALIDDGLDCQYSRVYHVMIGIGINPLPNRQDLMEAIKFSRSSDLAFLWFLYNSVYRTHEEFNSQSKYTYNERVILSCICHLDMLVTLRELDKILPKPDASCEPKRQKKTSGKRPKYPHILPPLPVPPLNIYDLYKDQFYVIENESNRWFSKDILVPSKSYYMAEKILADRISNVSRQKTNLHSEKFFKFSGTNDKILCGQHQKDSSKFFQLMNRLIDENQNRNFNEDHHKHLSVADRGIAYGMYVEFQKSDKEFNENSEKFEMEILVKTLLRQIVENSFDRRYLHLCQKCNETNENPLPNQLHTDDDDICNKTPKSSSYDPSIVKYYQRPSLDGSHPLTFDYEKIFSMDFLHDRGVVKNSINTALKLNKYLTVDNAITACLRDMWRAQLKEWNEKRQADIEERQQRVVANFSEIGRDKEKIFKLLRESIAIMRKNSKFVLAALPHSYRLPILREWILLRYGVKYFDKSFVFGKKRY